MDKKINIRITIVDKELLNLELTPDEKNDSAQGNITKNLFDLFQNEKNVSLPFELKIE